MNSLVLVDDQLDHLTRSITDVAGHKLVQNALRGLDNAAAERLIGDPQFAVSLREFIVVQIGKFSAKNKYRGERVLTKRVYHSSYKPRGLIEQIKCLRKLFSGIGNANQDLLTKIQNVEVGLPEHAEGWFAIPNWMKNPAIFGATYSEAVQKVLNAIEQSCGTFYNHRTDKINEEHLRQSPRSQKFWRDISEAQGNPDILIVAAQFGLRYRGCSVRCAREDIEASKCQFGLGIFANGVMILTHKERLMDDNGLYIDCPGDELDALDGEDRFTDAPYFLFHKGSILLMGRSIRYVCDHRGSSSGFL
jgi:hypothetical protein